MHSCGVAQVCLTDDDLAGLNWLYPSCEGAKNVRTCFHSARNIGYLRLFCWVVVPMLIGLAILLLMIAAVTVYDSFWVHGFITSDGMPPHQSLLRAFLLPSPRW